MDDRSRRVIATDFEHTLLVEAGAGSGKTTAMVSRIMQILIRGHADIREIVALTFTNEGAASLRGRILEELELAASSESYGAPGNTQELLNQEQLERIRNALQFLPLAHVTTIHGFCVSILKERPVEVGIDPKFDLNTEGNVIPVFDDAWLRFLMMCATTQHPFLRWALDQGVDIDEVYEIALIRSSHPDLVLHTAPVEPVTDKEIAGAFLEASRLIDRIEEHLPVLERDKESAAKEKRLEFVRLMLRRRNSCAPVTRQRSMFEPVEFLHRWPDKLKVIAEPLKELETLCTEMARRMGDEQHAKIAIFVEEFIVWFDAHKKSTSSLYFDDLLFFTREVLRKNREVRSYCKKRYRYLFIDETQDTDPLQTEIVFFLSERAGDFAESWSDVRLHPSKLFLVGDPKQSIYKFRRADIAMYEQAKEIIVGQGGKIISLQKNFRSAAPIITFVNEHFVKSFAGNGLEQERRFQPAYEELIPGAARQSNLPHHIFSITSPDTGKAGSKDTYLRYEAGKIIAFIRKITGEGGPSIVDGRSGEQRPVSFRDIMILMRAMTDVEIYEQLLESADIPHYQVGGKTFFMTEDIRGLVFCLQAIDDPTDTMSLFGALRSPVFGFSDQEIFTHVQQHHRFHLFSTGEEETGELSVALRILRGLHYQRERLKPSGTLKEVFNASGLPHVVMMEPNGSQKSARYFRLLELLYELESDRTLTFRAVINSLSRIMELDDPQLANVTIVKSAENAVKITTIHKAKGLEAPVVILANGKTSFRKTIPSSFVLRESGKIVVPFQKVGGFYGLQVEQLLLEEEEKEKCEEERLRYVAATRARDMLVVCVPSVEEGQNTFLGKFAGSLVNNQLVEPVSDMAGPTVAGQSGRRINLEKEISSAIAESDRRRGMVHASLTERSSCFVNVHDLMQADPDLFKTRHISRGKGFGRVLHRMMQAHVENETFDPGTLLALWMEDESVPVRHREDLMRVYETFSQSRHVVAAKASPRKYCEWEFFVKRGERIFNGVVDLVYATHDGTWVIVDYKTDDISVKTRRDRLVSFYEQQLNVYAESFQAITGQRVGMTVIVFEGEECGRVLAEAH